MNKRILIIGAGQLGSRYLQGIMNYQVSLDIYVYDILETSLKNAKERHLEVYNPIHNVIFANSFSNFPTNFDLCIVSTTARDRAKLIKILSEKFIINYWILEKVLAQNNDQLDQIERILGSSNAWVNTPYRIMKWYKEIKKHVNPTSTFQCEVSGGVTFGLACNMIHYIDLIDWFFNKKILKTNLNGLDNFWHESKRIGFWDIYGELEIFYDDGSVLKFNIKSKQKAEVIIKIETNENDIKIHESNGFVILNGEKCLIGRDEMQSEMTASVINEIFTQNKSSLTGISKSIVLHKSFLTDLLLHWNKANKKKSKILPIT